MSNEQKPTTATPQQTQGDNKSAPMPQQNQGDKSAPSPQHNQGDKPSTDKPAQQK